MGYIDQDRESNMYKYVGDKNLYAILGKYFDKLGGDYSIQNFINHSNEYFSDCNENYFSYYKIFEDMTDIFLEELNRVNSSFILSKNSSNLAFDVQQEIFGRLSEKYQEIRERVKESGDVKEYRYSFATLIDIVNYVRENSRVEQMKPLRDIVIDSIIDYDVLNPAQYSRYLDSVKRLYLIDLEKKLKAKYPTAEARNDSNNTEYENFKAAGKFLIGLNGIEYDRYIKEYNKKLAIIRKPYEEKMKALQEQMHFEEEQLKLHNSRVAFRENIVSKALYAALPEKQKLACATGECADTMSAIFNNPMLYRTPTKGTYLWNFHEFSKPEVILDTVARYSKNDIENQRVIAISYGYFNFGTKISAITGKPTIGSSYQIELVGVTRANKKGESNTYFAFVPFDSTLEREEDSRKNLSTLQNSYVNANEIKIAKDLVIKKKERIPKDLEQFYAQVFFSDAYLSVVTERYAGFTGMVDISEGKVRITKETSPIKTDIMGEVSPIEALMYAKTYGIYYKGMNNCTLNRIMSSDRVKSFQNGVVEERTQSSAKTNPKLPEHDDR